MVAVWVQDDPGAPVHELRRDGGHGVRRGGVLDELGGDLAAAQRVVRGQRLATSARARRRPRCRWSPTPRSAFDANHNFYIADEAHKADYAVGQLTTERFSFTGNAPTQTMFDNVDLAVDVGPQRGLQADPRRPTATRRTSTARPTRRRRSRPFSGGPFGAVYIAAQTSRRTRATRRSEQPGPAAHVVRRRPELRRGPRSAAVTVGEQAARPDASRSARGTRRRPSRPARPRSSGTTRRTRTTTT